MGKKQTGKVKVTVVLSATEKAALIKRARGESLSVAALIRRFALGLASVAIVGCGGEFSSTPIPDGSAGMSAGSGGMGASGSPGVAGTAGADVYDGPAWAECGDGILTARGFEAMLSEMRVIVAVDYWGDGYSLYPNCAIDGVRSPAASATMWTSSVEGQLVMFASHFDEAVGTHETPTGDVVFDDFVMVKSSTLTCEFQWVSSPSAALDPPSGMGTFVRCLVGAPGVEAVGAIR